MATPIIMLILMTAPYVLARLINAAAGRHYDLRSAGAIGLGILFLFTGSGTSLRPTRWCRCCRPLYPRGFR